MDGDIRCHIKNTNSHIKDKRSVYTDKYTAFSDKWCQGTFTSTHMQAHSQEAGP